jgi:hypothetical protein
VEEREARRIADIKRSAENFLNGKVADDAASRRRLSDVQTSINNLAAQVQQLIAQRKSLGLLSGEGKRQIDTQIAALTARWGGFEAEARVLAGQAQPSEYQWRVIGLDEANRRALAITQNIITEMPYHKPGGSITWAICILRTWLNTTFYNRLPAFVRSRVVAVTNQNQNNGSAPGGAPMSDRVFLLSLDEARQYFSNDADRIAKYQGEARWWWLRSPGSGGSGYAANVYSNGSVNSYGHDVTNGSGVRPALWLQL